MKIECLLEKAIQIAAISHLGQVDKAGQPYILHPLRVMMDCDTHDERIIAVLHDVLEDTSVTIDILKIQGCPEDLIDDLKLLTKKKDVDYWEYIKNISKSPRATKIKIFDLKDNLNILRLPWIEEHHLKLLQKYHKAVKYLGAIA